MTDVDNRYSGTLYQIPVLFLLRIGCSHPELICDTLPVIRKVDFNDQEASRVHFVLSYL